MTEKTIYYYGKKLNIDRIKEFYIKPKQINKIKQESKTESEIEVKKLLISDKISDKRVRREIIKYLKDNNFDDIELLIFENIFEETKYIITMKNIPKTKTIITIDHYFNITNTKNFCKIIYDLENSLGVPAFGTIVLPE